MPHCSVPELALKQRVVATIGESAAFSEHSPAWIHQQVAIALARAEAERKGEPVNESKGKGLKSIKVGGRRLVLVDSLCELMGITRDDLPDLPLSPAPKLAPRGLPAARARAAAAFQSQPRVRVVGRRLRRTPDDPTDLPPRGERA